MLRLEAKIDALSKENALLRDRVKKIETVRSSPQAPMRVAALGNSVSDAMPAVSNTEAARAARAASMPVKAMAPVRDNCAAHQWRGGYIGAHGGSAYHEAYRADSDGFLTDNSSYTLKKRGGIAGGHAGYNWASCSTWWGVEADGSWVSVKNTFIDNPNSGTTDNQIITRLSSLATARVRTGVALDNLALYVTGGVARARFSTTWADNPNTVQFKEWRTGWVAGFGTEYAWTSNFSIRSEVLYASFTDRDQTTVFAGIGPTSFRHADSVWVSRVAVNYRWGN